MSAEAVSDVIGELLPAESRRVLTQFGAVQHDLNDVSDFPRRALQVIATNEGSALCGDSPPKQGTAAVLASEARPAEPPAPGFLPSVGRAAARQRKSTPFLLPPSPCRRCRQSSPHLRRFQHAKRRSRFAASRPATEADLLQRLLQDAVAEPRVDAVSGLGNPWFLDTHDDELAMERVPALTPGQIEAMLTRAPAALAPPRPVT